MKRLILTLISLLFVPILSAKANELTKIRLCYTTLNEDIVTATAAVASEKNYFKSAGINLELKPLHVLLKEQPLSNNEQSENNIGRDEKKFKYFRGYEKHDAQILKQLNAGHCDLVSLAGEVVFLSSLKDSSDVDFLLSYFYGLNYDTNLLIPVDSKITSVKQLKGKTIRFGRFSTYLALREVLRSADIDLKDVELKFLKIAEIEKGLQNKTVDASIVYNPTAPLLLAKGAVKILEENVFLKFYKNYVPSYSLVVSKKFMNTEQNKKLIQNFLAAYKRASEVVSKNPEEIIYALQRSASKGQDAHKNYKTTPAEIEKAAEIMKIMPPFFYVKGMNNESSKADINAQKAFDIYDNFQRDLLNEHLIDKKIPLDFLKIKAIE